MNSKHIAKGKAQKLAKTLIRQNENGWSWRELAGFFPPNPEGKCLIKAGTLNRIAKSGGAWLPKDEKILDALGLITRRSPYAIMPSYFHRTPEALSWFLHKRQLAKGIAEDTKKAQKGRQ